MGSHVKDIDLNGTISEIIKQDYTWFNMNSSTCTICQMCFDTVLAKKVHEQQVHIFVFQCEYCETKFTSDENLRKHVASTCSEKLKKKRRKSGTKLVDNNKRNLLDIDNSDEKQKRNIVHDKEGKLKSKDSRKDNRVKSKHLRKEAKAVVAFECSECESLFKSEEALSKHEDVHMKEKNNFKSKHDNPEYRAALEKAELLPGLLDKEKLLQAKLDKLKTKAVTKLNKVSIDTYDKQSEYGEVLEKANNLNLLMQKHDRLQQNLKNILEANTMKENNDFHLTDNDNQKTGNKINDQDFKPQHVEHSEYSKILEKANNLEFILQKHEKLQRKLEKFKQKIPLKNSQNEMGSHVVTKDVDDAHVEPHVEHKNVEKGDNITEESKSDGAIDTNVEEDENESLVPTNSIEYRKLKAKKAREEKVKELRKRVEEKRREREEALSARQNKANTEVTKAEKMKRIREMEAEHRRL